MLRCGLLRENPQGEARAADEDKRDEPVNAKSGARHSRQPFQIKYQEHHTRSQYGCSCDCNGDESQFICAGVNPQAAIQTKIKVNGNFYQQRHRRHHQRGGKIKGQLIHIQPQRKTPQHRDDDEGKVAN